ncbi:MAG: ABC transporter ATP-binding protein [Symbiobacterium sp.]|uniref:ABC transporter ATP-binding protein n=1 Tax=Symbiobacterium sp. TaxID=1971213 RepID=UPI003463B70F
MTDALLVAEGLVKRYGSHTVVNGVSLRVRAGEIFGLLGPNGAGKTTTLEMLEGLRRPDSGRCLVCGHDTIREANAVRRLIGISLQAAAIPGDLQVVEVLEMYASFYPDPVPVRTLLEQFDLAEKARVRCAYLSGGQRQRLQLALALVGRPKVIFLDEPTTGLDPHARRQLWSVIRAMRSEGRAVILTTHYMEEAEYLCDTVAVLDGGRILASGPPSALIAEHGPDSVLTVTLKQPCADEPALAELTGVSRAAVEQGEIRLHTSRPAETLSAFARLAQLRGWELAEMNLRTATLEDVFFALTGRRLAN